MNMNYCGSFQSKSSAKYCYYLEEERAGNSETEHPTNKAWLIFKFTKRLYFKNLV